MVPFLRRRPRSTAAKSLPRSVLAALGAGTVLLSCYSVLAWTEGEWAVPAYGHGWPLEYLVREDDAAWRLWAGICVFRPGRLIANLAVAGLLSVAGYLLALWLARRPRRLWQVSVRELMAGSLLVAVVASSVAWHRQDVAREGEIVERLRSAGWETLEWGRPRGIALPLGHLGIDQRYLPDWLSRTVAVRWEGDYYALGKPTHRDPLEVRQGHERLAEFAGWIGALRYCLCVVFEEPSAPDLAPLSDGQVAAMLPHFRRMRILFLGMQAGTDETAKTIAAHCPSLEALCLDVEIGDEGVAALAGLTELRLLVLRDSCSVSARGRRQLLAHRQLRDLSASPCWESDEEFLRSLRDAGIEWHPSTVMCSCGPE